MSKHTAEQVEAEIANYAEEAFPREEIDLERVTDMLRDYAALLRERESARAAVTDDLDYVPGELDRTAPVRIWLQIDTVASSNDREEPWPGCDDVTWQDESIGGLEIQYVRADLVVPMLASARVPDAIKCQVGRGACGEGFDEGWNACREAMLAAAPKRGEG